MPASKSSATERTLSLGQAISLMESGKEIIGFNKHTRFTTPTTYRLIGGGHDYVRNTPIYTFECRSENATDWTELDYENIGRLALVTLTEKPTRREINTDEVVKILLHGGTVHGTSRAYKFSNNTLHSKKSANSTWGTSNLTLSEMLQFDRWTTDI